MSARAIGGARSATVITMLAILGCGATMSAGGSANSLVAGVRTGAVNSRSILTRADLASTNASTTLEAIERLRPEFLLGHARPPALGRAQIVVYVNDRYEGDLSLLNTIPLSEIRELSLLQPNEALFRFGSACRCPGGVVVVNTR